MCHCGDAVDRWRNRAGIGAGSGNDSFPDLGDRCHRADLRIQPVEMPQRIGRVCSVSGRAQIAQSDFLGDEVKNGGNPLWISEYFRKVSQERCKQDACEKMLNRL